MKRLASRRAVRPGTVRKTAIAIDLPQRVEDRLQACVVSGEFASLDDAFKAAVWTWEPARFVALFDGPPIPAVEKDAAGAPRMDLLDLRALLRAKWPGGAP